MSDSRPDLTVEAEALLPVLRRALLLLGPELNVLLNAVPAADETLLSVKDVATYLNVSVRTVERLIAEQELKPSWIKGRRRFTHAAVEAFLNRCPGRRSNLRRKRYSRRTLS